MYMSDYGRNFINMFGSQNISQLNKEVNLRLSQLPLDDAIPNVFYGLDRSSDADILKLTGSDWVIPASTAEFGDEDQLCFKSSCLIPEKLENHLVWFYSKIDPHVVLRNKYDNESGSFIGVRYKVVSNGKIFTAHRREEIHSEVVYDESKLEEGQITWEDLWDIQDRLNLEASKELSTQFPYVAQYTKQL
jgi:hypothetical protein